MTIAEKRKAIKNFCSNRSCNECPLGEIFSSCWDDVDLIDRNYKILFGPDTTPVNTCISCGAEIPEGRQVCPDCEAKVNETPDPIKPEYYNDTKITPFDVIDDWRLNFYLGNAVKYIKRAGKKAGNSRLQDLKKIREYIDHEIRAEEG